MESVRVPVEVFEPGFQAADGSLPLVNLLDFVYGFLEVNLDGFLQRPCPILADA